MSKGRISAESSGANANGTSSRSSAEKPRGRKLFGGSSSDVGHGSPPPIGHYRSESALSDGRGVHSEEMDDHEVMIFRVTCQNLPSLT